MRKPSRRSITLLFATLAAGCASTPPNESSAKVDDKPADEAVANTPDREACLAIEATFRTLRNPLERSGRPPFFPSSKDDWTHLAEKHEGAVKTWRDKRSTLSGATARIGDAFAEKLDARAKIARNAKLPAAPEPPPKNASPEDRKKAAIEEAAREALADMVPKDAAEVDRKALEKNVTDLEAIQKEYVGACLPLIYADPSPLASQPPSPGPTTR